MNFGMEQYEYWRFAMFTESDYYKDVFSVWVVFVVDKHTNPQAQELYKLLQKKSQAISLISQSKENKNEAASTPKTVEFVLKETKLNIIGTFFIGSKDFDTLKEGYDNRMKYRENTYLENEEKEKYFFNSIYHKLVEISKKNVIMLFNLN